MTQIKYIFSKTPYPIMLASSVGAAYLGFTAEWLLGISTFGLVGFGGLGATGLLLAGGAGYFHMNKNKILKSMEEDKFRRYKSDIQEKYHDIGFDSAIFDKIEKIQNLIASRFSSTSMFTLRVFETINTSLDMYLANLELIKDYKALEGVTSKDYSEQIEKNVQQNKDIVDNLDGFIEKVIHDKSNDKEMEYLMSSFEKSVDLYQKVNKISNP